MANLQIGLMLNLVYLMNHIGTLFFLVYINDLPDYTSDDKPDDASLFSGAYNIKLSAINFN